MSDGHDEALSIRFLLGCAGGASSGTATLLAKSVVVLVSAIVVLRMLSLG